MNVADEGDEIVFRVIPPAFSNEMVVEFLAYPEPHPAKGVMDYTGETGRETPRM